MKFIIKSGLIILFLFNGMLLYSQSAKKNESKPVTSENDKKTTNDKIHWISFDEAIKLNSGYPKKKILIDVYTDWCGWCKKMDAVTFSNPVIASYINEHYWAVKLNAEGYDTIIYNGVTYTNTK